MKFSLPYHGVAVQRFKHLDEVNLSVANKIICLCDLPLEVEDAPGPLSVDDKVGVEHHEALDSFPTLEGAVDDEELADQGVEQDGLVVVGPGRGKLVVRRKLQAYHQALDLGVHLAGQVRGHNVKGDEGVGA